MRESPRQPAQLDPEDEESLAVLGHLIESSQDTATQAADFMNLISKEITQSEGRLEELRRTDKAASHNEIPIVENMLVQLKENYTEAQNRYLQAERDVADYKETRKLFIEGLKGGVS